MQLWFWTELFMKNNNHFVRSSSGKTNGFCNNLLQEYPVKNKYLLVSLCTFLEHNVMITFKNCNFIIIYYLGCFLFLRHLLVMILLQVWDSWLTLSKLCLDPEVSLGSLVVSMRKKSNSVGTPSGTQQESYNLGKISIVHIGVWKHGLTYVENNYTVPRGSCISVFLHTFLSFIL